MFTRLNILDRYDSDKNGEFLGWMIKNVKATVCVYDELTCKIEKGDLFDRLENMMMELLKRNNGLDWNKFLIWRAEVKQIRKKESEALENLRKQKMAYFAEQKRANEMTKIKDSAIFLGWVGLFTLLYHL